MAFQSISGGARRLSKRCSVGSLAPRWTRFYGYGPYKIQIWITMKLYNFYYLINSITLICLFFIICSYYYDSQNKQKQMDEYYLLEYTKAYRLVFRERVAVNLDEITKKAVEDGYKHYEIDTLRKKTMDNEYTLWLQIKNEPEITP